MSDNIPSGSVVDHIDLIPDLEIGAQMVEGEPWRNMGLRMWERTVAICPVSRQNDVMGPYKVGGALKASIEIRFTFGTEGHIEIGSRHTVTKGYALLALLELGTEDHDVSPVNASVLVFFYRGHWVFTPNTVHPRGIKANPFVERAAQQILHEMDGVTLVALA